MRWMLGLLVSATVAALQPVRPATIPLHASKDYGLIPAFSAHRTIQCDAKGDLYFTISDGSFTGGDSPLKILRLAPDGSDQHVYAIPYAPGRYFMNLQVDANGDLHQLAATNAYATKDSYHVYVFSWKRDASESTQVDLGPNKSISFEKLTWFESSLLFFNISYSTQAKEKLWGRDDARIDFWRAKTKAMDEQGVMYLVINDKILVISKTGDVLRELTPEKPSPEYWISHIEAVKGRLAVWFSKSKQDEITTKLPFADSSFPTTTRLELVDSTNGDVLRLFEPDKELGNNAVCFTGDAFTFYRLVDGNIRFFTAAVG